VRAWLLNSGVPIVIAMIVGLSASVVFSRQAPSPIEVRAPQLQPTATAVIYIHVDGAVTAPGVYALPPGGHVFEAVDAAGGATTEADTASLNLAAKVADGQKLVVPLRRVTSDEVSAIARPDTASVSQPAAAATGASINVNTGTQKILESLPGIGPVTATKIIARRNASGPFTRIEQLRDEKIVNASTYERIKALISVD